MANRPTIKSPCVADHYASTGERIVEFAFPGGAGGLIALRDYEEGAAVEVYRTDGEVRVIVDHEANAKAYARKLLRESEDRAAAYNAALNAIDEYKNRGGINALIEALLYGEAALIIHDNRED